MTDLPAWIEPGETATLTFIPRVRKEGRTIRSVLDHLNAAAGV